jgi:Fur family transcriptional regulator, ferric uptake regulator
MVSSNIADLLRKSGHKATPQRMAIINVVLESKELLSPAALLAKVRRVDPEVGEVTVYRTLNILFELGLVCMVHTGENTHSYISRPPEHHGHVICSGCGKVVDFLNCNLSELEQKLMNDTGFDIKEHRLDFYGICRQCRLQEKKGQIE